MNNNYGSHEIPTEVLKLIELENDLQSEGKSLAHFLLLRPAPEAMPYSITPPDFIPFAETGGDGIQFGFLTDFGETTDLSKAPIICVTPTNDPPIRYMARSFIEFIDLVISMPNAELLESIWACPNQQAVDELLEEVSQYSTIEHNAGNAYLKSRLANLFNAKPKNVLSYFFEIKAERANQLAIPTLDGLGVIGSDIRTRATFNFQQSITGEELDRMREFTREASRMEKLAFIRDANYRYVGSPDYENELWLFILELLRSMDLKDEATRVELR